MDYKLRNKKAFTLIELLVAIGILVIVLSFASVIFKVSIEAHRTAIANAEIMQKLRAITDQLNADFKGLRKDGEIFIVWVAAPKRDVDLAGLVDPNSYERFDKIMFFADGDFQSYGTNPVVRGNIARICYMLARNSKDVKAQGQEKTERILARTQHILTSDNNPLLAEFILDPNTFGGTVQEWYDWNNILEYDRVTLEGWKNIRWDIDPNDPRGPDQPCKMNMLSVITDIRTSTSVSTNLLMGATVVPSESNSIHMLLCEGVGEFKIQGWYDAQQRWVPELNPDGDDSLSDTDFILDPADPTRLDPNKVPGVLYPYRVIPSMPYGQVILGGTFSNEQYKEILNESNFNLIPGLGRALKFTFTLYDSKGIIKQGRTFTHIVYLDD